MFKNKLVIVAVAGMLAMCFGLVACGGNNASSSSASSSSSSSSSSASSSSSSSSSSSAAAEEVAYWQGTHTDGSLVYYMDDAATSSGALAIIKSDLTDGSMWVGAYTVTGDGMVTITDADTKQNINFTIVDVSPRTSMTLDIENYGEVQLKSVSASEFEAEAQEFAKTVKDANRYIKKLNKAAKKLEKKVAKEAKKLMAEIEKLDDSAILFWDATLADGSTVSFMDDPQTSQAFLCVINADYSDGAAWYGKYTTDQSANTITLTDSESGKSVTYNVIESNGGNSLTLDVTGYGQVNFKPVTKAEFMAYADELAKLAGDTTSTSKSSSSSASSSSSSSSSK